MMENQDLQTILPTAEWLDEQSEHDVEQEIQEANEFFQQSIEMLQEKEAALIDLAQRSGISLSQIQTENNNANSLVDELFVLDEQEHENSTEPDDTAIIQQLVLEDAFDLDPLTVGGNRSGSYKDFHPYHGWGKVYKHNEGGKTIGSSATNKSARRMYPYAYARGDGIGITDDNDVTTWTKLFFAFWPSRRGIVRAYVPFKISGLYRIYSNDKWYNSKEAKVDLRVYAKLYQSYWGPQEQQQVFSRSDDNINQRSRIERDPALYTRPLQVGERKWVIAEVAVRAHVETEGSGSTGMLDFRPRANYIWVPYVRFDYALSAT